MATLHFVSLQAFFSFSKLNSLYSSQPLLQNFNIELFYPECTVPMDFWTKYSFKMFFPVIFCIFMGTILLFKRSFVNLKSEQLKGSTELTKIDRGWLLNFRDLLKKVELSRLPSLFFIIIVTMYAFIVSTSVSPFNCQKQSDNQYVMTHSPSEACYSGQWLSYLPFMVISAFVYTIVLPGIVLYFLLDNRKDLDEPSFVFKFGSITSPYRRKYFYWEFVSMAKRTAFVFSSEFITSSGSYIVKLSVTCSIIAFFMYLEARCMPYSTNAYNFIAST
jgi:hypothetical protein